MNQDMLVKIVLGLIALLVGAAATYLQSSTKIKGTVTEYIAQAEEMYKDTTKAGGQKFNWVVEQLYTLVPSPLRVVFTRQLIGAIVQNAFDAVQRYAKAQLDKAFEKMGGPDHE